MNEQAGTLAKVLLVDDRLAEIQLAEIGLLREKVHLELTSIRDGEAVIGHLQQQSEVPDLVLLDINLPTMDGKDILAMMKQDPDLKDIPVVMYSGSDAPRDMKETKELGALDYIVKPLNYTALKTVVEKIPQLQFSEDGADKYLYRVKS